MKGFVTMTAHHINKNWALENFVLRGLALEVALNDDSEVAHENAANLLHFLKDSLEEFQVSPQNFLCINLIFFLRTQQFAKKKRSEASRSPRMRPRLWTLSGDSSRKKVSVAFVMCFTALLGEACKSHK